jgi:hypothetical protein
MLMFDQRKDILWSYDPGERKWSKITPKGPPPPGRKGKVIGYYDPARNVFVLNRGADVWVYRHKATTQPKADQ